MDFTRTARGLLRALSSALALSGFAGCASIVNDATHPMKIEAKIPDGRFVVGANCKLSNDYGGMAFKSGDTVPVRRSSTDLDILCIADGGSTATGRAISRANAGMWGNIIAGGGIGAIIDHNKGTAYTYPTWVQLIFGRSLTFDRSAEVAGSPVAGVVAAGAQPAAEPQVVTQATSAVPVSAMPPVQPALQPTPQSPAAPPPTAPPQVAVPPLEAQQKRQEPVRIGPDSRMVEAMPDVRRCNPQPVAMLVGEALASLATYSVTCTNRDTVLIRCEYGNCRMLK